MATDFPNDFQAFLRDVAQHPAPRLRLAPTPSGYLHLGNALNFILNARSAHRSPKGGLLLRIDDLDAERKRPEYVEDVFETLHWLHIDWNEGPRTPADFEENWSQHHRLPLYFQLLDKLRDTGALFACRKSRRDLAPFGGAYPEAFRAQNLSLDDPDVAWRLQTPPGFPLPDFIVRRRDGLPAYQVASLADDLHFGITHIIRGEDLAASTAAQRLLAERTGLREFLSINFLHHPVLRDERGEKLSKSAGAGSLKAMRESGVGGEWVYGNLEGFIP